VAHRRPPRLSDDCYRGFGRYFLTVCTADRREHFTSEAAVEPMRSELLRTSSDYRFEVTAYCAMPDHAHALFGSLAEDCDFKRFVKMFKQRSAFHHKCRCGQKLWQDGYFDRVLRVDEPTLDVVAYMLANPVKAGLCTDPHAYPFSGSSLYSLDESCDAVAARPRGNWQP